MRLANRFKQTDYKVTSPLIFKWLYATTLKPLIYCYAINTKNSVGSLCLSLQLSYDHVTFKI